MHSTCYRGPDENLIDGMPDKSTVYPKADHATFRDLNIFEEWLRETAAGLQQRKSRYQCMWLVNLTSVLGSDWLAVFLAQLLVVIALLLAEVLLLPDVSMVSIPYNVLLRWLLPDCRRNLVARWFDLE